MLIYGISQGRYTVVGNLKPALGILSSFIRIFIMNFLRGMKHEVRGTNR